MTPTLIMVDDLTRSFSARGREIALLQAAQISLGFLSQLFLLRRWSPHLATDIFLLTSTIPGLVGSVLLFGTMEFALPAAYHKLRREVSESAANSLIMQVTRLGWLAGLAGALVSGALVFAIARSHGLQPDQAMWLALGLGAQMLPAILSGIWRGVMLARDQLIRLRISLLAGSLITLLGFAFLSVAPAAALSMTVLVASTLSAMMARSFTRSNLTATQEQPIVWIQLLGRPMITLAALSVLVSLQAIAERGATLILGTGALTAYTVTVRGWDAIMTVIVAATVTPIFPYWSNQASTNARGLLKWSLWRTGVLSITAAMLVWGGFQVGASLLSRLLSPETSQQVHSLMLAGLPRFLLVSALQPLIVKHIAQGTPWHLVVATAMGIIVIEIGRYTIIPLWRFVGLALTLALSVIPGWIYLTWLEIHAC